MFIGYMFILCYPPFTRYPFIELDDFMLLRVLGYYTRQVYI
jgi:hypothetical protein